MQGARLLVALALVGPGCDGDGKAQPDAAVDGSGSDGSGDCVDLAGELVDLDSSTAAFAGIPGAVVAVEGMPAVAVTTPPNGRVQLCVPDVDPIRLTIDAPSTYLDASVYLEPEAAKGPPDAAMLSMRSFTEERAAAFYSERGLAYDDTKAHVLVLSAGDRVDLALDRAHDAAQAGNDDATAGTYEWAAGAAGRYVLFPNVAVAQATGTLSGDGPESHVIPLAAGTLTFVGVYFVVL